MSSLALTWSDHTIVSVANVTLCDLHKVSQPDEVSQDSWDIYVTLTEVLLYYHHHYYQSVSDDDILFDRIILALFVNKNI